MKIKCFYLVLLFLPALYFSGCQYPPARVEILGPKIGDRPISGAETQLIERKTSHLEQMLLDDKLEPEERRVIKGFIDVYSSLQRLFILTEPDPGNREVSRGLLKKITALEEDYFVAREMKRPKPSERFDHYHNLRSAIFESYRVKNYKGVIDQCLILEEQFGPQALTPEIGLILALSLAETQMTSEAIKVGERIIRHLEGQPDLLLLRVKLIEWYLAEGMKNKALDVYEKLSEDLDYRYALKTRSGDQLQALQAKKTDQERELIQPDLPTEPWLREILRKAERLAEQQAFTEAKLLLIKTRIKTEDQLHLQFIDQALKDIEMKQERTERDQGPIYQASDKQVLEQAAALIEEEKYEEAITTLEKIEGQQRAPNIETRRLKNLAIEKIINRDRNRAAQLYLQSRQVQERSQKRKFLQSSLDILNNLVDQYPSSYLIERVNEHIAIVSKALADL